MMIQLQILEVRCHTDKHVCDIPFLTAPVRLQTELTAGATHAWPSVLEEAQSAARDTPSSRCIMLWRQWQVSEKTFTAWWEENMADSVRNIRLDDVRAKHNKAGACVLVLGPLTP